MDLDPEIKKQYQPIIGLEVHAQLKTQSKAYSSDPNDFHAKPNTNVSPVTLGHPGTLPRYNKSVIDYAIKLGIACASHIHSDIYYARKNYFYPDLPKGYQISQDETPICTGGGIRIKNGDKERDINLTRIHMEEDAGKSIHDQDPFNTLVDLNRAGVPLVEIVTEPELRSAEDAYSFLIETRKLVRYLDICDGNMEEGSLRCDVNVSVMQKGASEYGQRAEIKNMNSMRNVQKAIEHEIERQIISVEKGEKIPQETRSFDPVSGQTSRLRTKESAHDYRYFPEPDLNPIHITQKHLQSIKDDLPPLPNALMEKYIQELGLSQYDAQIITDQKEIALYFEDLIQNTDNFKAAANWIMGDIKSHLNKNAISILEFPVSPVRISEMIRLIDENKINKKLAAEKILPNLIEDPEKTVLQIAEENNWIQSSDEGDLEPIVKEVIEEHPDEVERYQNGEKKLTGFFMGKIMKKSKGKADPKSTNILLQKLLNQ